MKTLTLDIETTGLPPKNADYEIQFMEFPYIVSLAFKVGEEETKHYIINQEGRKITPEMTAIHGITNEMAEASPYYINAVIGDLILAAVGTEVTVGHNIYFDSSIIKANVLRLIQEGRANREFYEKLQVIFHKDRRVDTMKSTVSFCGIPGPRGLKWPKLIELHQILFNEGFEAHNSKNDVDATHRCYKRLKELKVL